MASPRHGWAREFRLPVVITARGTDINLIPEYARPRRLILEAAQSAGALITVCQALKDRMVELGRRRPKSRCCATASICRLSR